MVYIAPDFKNMEYVMPVASSDNEYSCHSVAGGWQTYNMKSNQYIGPAFHRIQDLWSWQSDNLYNEVNGESV